jgi:group I intron endonuclease
MDSTHIIGIYKITSPSGKIYIGQSQNILSNRLNHYINGNCSTQTKLYNSLQKYSFENHIFEIIEECSLEQLNDKEIYWGLFYHCCFSIKHWIFHV